MKRYMEHLVIVVLVLAAITIALGAIAYSGLYNIGADDRHWSVTLQLLQSVRDRSIHVRSEKLPDLTPQQYKDIVAEAPPDEDMNMSPDR